MRQITQSRLALALTMVAAFAYVIGLAFGAAAFAALTPQTARPACGADRTATPPPGGWAPRVVYRRGAPVPGHPPPARGGQSGQSAS